VFDVTITQDGAEVTRAKLARYKAVVFFTAINPPGVDVDGLVAWVRDGGAFVGIHSTANTYQGHPDFGAMLGARYDRRPWRTGSSADQGPGEGGGPAHPATRHLGESFELADDLYQFKDFDRSKARLLLSLDPASLDLENPRSTAGPGLPRVLGEGVWQGARVLHGAGGLGGDLEGPTLPDAPGRGHPVGDGDRGRQVTRVALASGNRV
jgi:hypothetical protein